MSNVIDYFVKSDWYLIYIPGEVEGPSFAKVHSPDSPKSLAQSSFEGEMSLRNILLCSVFLMLTGGKVQL